MRRQQQHRLAEVRRHVLPAGAEARVNWISAMPPAGSSAGAPEAARPAAAAGCRAAPYSSRDRPPSRLPVRESSRSSTDLRTGASGRPWLASSRQRGQRPDERRARSAPGRCAPRSPPSPRAAELQHRRPEQSSAKPVPIRSWAELRHRQRAARTALNSSTIMGSISCPVSVSAEGGEDERAPGAARAEGHAEDADPARVHPPGRRRSDARAPRLHQETANFRSLIAAKSLTSPPIRLVA